LTATGGVGAVLASTTGNDTQNYLYDKTGNVIGTTDSTGAMKRTISYSPFGEIIGDKPDIPFTFSTKATDSSGLSYYGFRYYSPDIGRWTNRDPIGEMGEWNLYGMVRNNTVKWWDYLGLWRPQEHVEITVEAILTSISADPQEAKSFWQEYQEVFDLIVDSNKKVDEGESYYDLKQHYNRGIDANIGSAREAYSQHLTDLESEFHDKIKDHPTKDECNDALKLLGQLTHSWEDFYAHAIASEGDDGDPGELTGNPDSPGDAVPSSWGGNFNLGEHGIKEPAWRRPDGGKERRSQSTSFVEHKIDAFMGEWWNKCQCQFQKK